MYVECLQNFSFSSCEDTIRESNGATINGRLVFIYDETYIVLR